MLSQKRQSYRILLNTMAIKHKIKFKSDRARGTSPAELRSTGPKQRPERVATKPGVEGESIRRDVPDNDNEYRCGGAYRAILAMFAKHFKKEENEKEEK